MRNYALFAALADHAIEAVEPDGEPAITGVAREVGPDGEPAVTGVAREVEPVGEDAVIGITREVCTVTDWGRRGPSRMPDGSSSAARAKPGARRHLHDQIRPAHLLLSAPSAASRQRVVPQEGFEPPTYALRMRRSTN